MLARAILDNGPAVDIDDIDDKLETVTPDVLAGVADPKATLKAMAGLVDGKHFGQEDLFYILTHTEVMTDGVAEKPLLRQGLDYPAADKAGVKTDFKTLPLEKGGQVAYIVITPEKFDPAKKPLIFLTGLQHKSAIYYDSLVKMAKKEGREIISIDLPSAGGTRLPGNASVYSSDLYDVAVKIIGEEIASGETFDLMGHSLGAIPAVEIRAAFKERKLPELLKGRSLGRVVLVAPVPDEEMRMMGDRINGNFAKLSIFQALFTGGIASAATHLFFNDHSEIDQKDLTAIIGREEHSSSLWSTCSNFFSRYMDPVMGDVGVDADLRIVFPSDDKLMLLRDQEDWRGKRGVYFIDGADHSFMAGRYVPQYQLDQLLYALNDTESFDASPRLELGGLYRRFNGNVGVAASYSSSGFIGVSAAILARFGLLHFGSGGGIDLGFGNEVVAGYDYNRKDALIGMHLHAGLGYKVFQLPLRFDGGLLLQTNMYVNERNDTPLQISPYAGFQFEMEDAMFLSARFLFPAFVGDDSTDWSTQVNLGFLF